MINRNQNNNVRDIDEVIRKNFRIILYAYDYLNVFGNRGIDFKSLKFNSLTIRELNVSYIRTDRNGHYIIGWDAFDGVDVYWTATRIKKDDIQVCIREAKLRIVLD